MTHRWIHPAPGTLAMGVEEELLLVDAHTLAAAPGAAAVLGQLAARAPGRVSPEITTLQVEIKSVPQVNARELHDELLQLRSQAAGCAAEEGLRVVASGLPVLGDVVPPPITEGERYAEGLSTYRTLHDEHSMCAFQVHVDIPDLPSALEVSNRLRPWLPVLLAVAANSPYFAGRDSGYASRRTLAWGRWPVAGAPPYFRSPAHYEELLGVLEASGALVDLGTVYWDVRPAPRQPSIEVRVADMTGTAAESAVLAALVRALVAVSLDETRRGDGVPDPSSEVLRAAYWRAARDGLSGLGLDVRTGEAVPAAVLFQSMVAHALPALEHYGDAELVVSGMDRLVSEGCGAARQRAAAGPREELGEVVRFLISQTVSDWLA